MGVRANASLIGKTRGLFGDNDGDISEDLTARDGTVLPANSSTQDIYDLFGLSWEVVNDEDILFPKQRGKRKRRQLERIPRPIRNLSPISQETDRKFSSFNHELGQNDDECAYASTR